MPTFASKPLGQPHSAVRNARTRPVLYFGLPFIGIIVAGSFALSSLTSTRYELRDSKVTALSKEEELHMDKNRKKIDIREEYFRLRGSGDGESAAGWENKRIERLPGQAEWGELPVSRDQAK